MRQLSNCSARTVWKATRRARRAMLCPAVLTVALVAPSGAVAAPANDAFSEAAAITDLPFSDTVDGAGATTEAGEPQSCISADATVWYKLTPSAAGTIAADTGSSFPAQITAYRADGDGVGGLTFLSCANFGTSRAVFEVRADETYYLQASMLFGSGGPLQVNVARVEAPTNDAFADAKHVTTLPYVDSPDMTAATVEDGEPAACQGISARGTAWYAFTPQESGSYVLRRDDFGPLGAYTGDSVSSLTNVACSFGPTFFRAEAGATYYIQVGSLGGQAGRAQLTVDVAPAAIASFFFFPSDPSSLDRVQFLDTSFDFAGIVSRTWELGDATTAAGCCPTHRYAADGEYEARLAITTTDGRTASSAQAVRVATHDVAITQLAVPTSARVGRARQINVDVNNSRYPETVQVSMLRSVAGGDFEEVGQVTQGVPARKERRSTTFSISYTFTQADAAIGKVTFKAVATILSARDANPADNTVIATPTKVNP